MAYIGHMTNYRRTDAYRHGADGLCGNCDQPMAQHTGRTNDGYLLCPHFCEYSATGLDSTLRSACGEPATLGAYDKVTHAIEHYVCSAHVGNVPRTYGTVILPGVSVQRVKSEMGF